MYRNNCSTLCAATDGITFHVLEKADPQVLGEAQHLWGSYYQQKPYVLAIDVAEALQVARQLYQFSH
ncbi:thermostable hemolysin [Acinetobacter lwoffii]|nr:thermostable hemolysin [Acinetobacter lwoffii]